MPPSSGGARRGHRSDPRVLLGRPKKHHGRVYVARRVVAAWMNARARATRAPGSPVSIDGATLLAELPGDAVVEAQPGEHVRLTPPREAKARFARIPEWYRSDWWKLDHDLGPQRVLSVPGGVVFGYEGWIGPDRRRVVRDWNAFERSELQFAQAVDRSVAEGVVEWSGTTASLLQLAQENYFHWIVQGLPRLLAILDTVGTTRVDRFLFGHDRPFINESLDLLGIGPDRRAHVTYPAAVHECDVLVTSSWPEFLGPPPRWVLERLRALFLPVRERVGSTRIYVSRAEASRRHVVNDGEVRAALERHGFVAVSMDTMTVAEQAATFAEADVVVGAHGAALANLVFARPGTRVVELLPANNPRPHFWHLASRVGAEYEAVVGSEPALRRRHDVWMNDADLVVDVRELERIVAG